MMANYRDGWHKISGYIVYIEDDYITKILSKDCEEFLSIYEKDLRKKYDSEWVKIDKIKVFNFWNRMRKGSIKVM